MNVLHHSSSLGSMHPPSALTGPLLHLYFPPLSKNMRSSNPLLAMAASTPTSSNDLDGVFSPAVQSKKRMYSSKIWEGGSGRGGGGVRV